MKIEKITSPCFLFLNDKTPLQSKLSDHNILINNNVLFFNMMMQAKWNHEKKRFNNGFALIENVAQYRARLSLIAQLLAEAVFMNPQISIIGLVEAPIGDNINYFINELAKYPSLHRFTKNLTPKNFTALGVATLFDGELYEVKQVTQLVSSTSYSLYDRVQEFIVTKGEEKFRLFNLHLPYDVAKSKDNIKLINFAKELFKEEEQKIPVMVLGDFNIDPNLISKRLPQISSYSQKPNNLLINTNEQGEFVDYKLENVDAILNTTSLTPYNLFYHDASKLKWHGTNPKTESHLFKNAILSKMLMFHGRCKKTLIAIITIAASNKHDSIPAIAMQ